MRGCDLAVHGRDRTAPTMKQCILPLSQATLIPCTNSPLRRIPRQRRSRRRVADMISAAIDLLVLGGTEAVTTSAVAEKAGVPIGSVYQFFPDRGTLLLAVAEVSSRPLQETAQLIKADSDHQSRTRSVAHYRVDTT